MITNIKTMQHTTAMSSDASATCVRLRSLGFIEAGAAAFDKGVYVGPAWSPPV